MFTPASTPEEGTTTTTTTTAAAADQTLDGEIEALHLEGEGGIGAAGVFSWAQANGHVHVPAS